MKTFLFVLVLASFVMPVFAQGYSLDGVSFVELDGAVACQKTFVVTPTSRPVVGVSGICVGAGKGFIDLRVSMDACTIRCEWQFETVPKRDAYTLCVGTLTQQGHLKTLKAKITPNFSPGNTMQNMRFDMIDGAEAYRGSAKSGRWVGIKGICVGAGKTFIDLRIMMDGKVVRCEWPFQTIPKRDADVLCVGMLSSPGHLQTTNMEITLK